MMKSIGVVIGPSGIGKAHIRELVNYGFQNICLLGKKYRKDRLYLLKKEYNNLLNFVEVFLNKL